MNSENTNNPDAPVERNTPPNVGVPQLSGKARNEVLYRASLPPLSKFEVRDRKNKLEVWATTEGYKDKLLFKAGSIHEYDRRLTQAIETYNTERQRIINEQNRSNS